MNNLNISEVLSDAWELAKKHGLMLTVLIFVLQLCISSVFSGVSIEQYQYMYHAMSKGQQLNPEMLQTNYFGVTAGNLVLQLAFVGVYVSLLGIIKGERNGFSFDAWKLPLNVYLKYVAVVCLQSLIVLVGILCCFVPGVYLYLRLQFSEIYVLEHPEAGIIESLKASWNITGGNVINLLGLCLAFIVAAVIGLLCCCVGVMFAYAFIIIASVVAYVKLKPLANL